MKRHPALVSLSSEHHHGLVWGKKLLSSDDAINPAEFSRIIDEFFQVWEKEINPHFNKEEEILLPLFNRSGHALDSPVMEMCRQHILIRAQVFNLEDSRGMDTAHEIGNLLKDHIRFEERELFPFIEENSSEKLLQRIGKELG